MSNHDHRPACWYPSDARVRLAELTRYMGWLRQRAVTASSDYDALWRWSIDQPDAFWGSVWDYFDVVPPRTGAAALSTRTMPGVSWFAGEHANYARVALGHPDHNLALIARDEQGIRARMTYGDLRARVAAAAQALKRAGIGEGDRVVAILPNTETTVVVFLAAAAIGAVWALCSPEFGAESIIARFAQLRPAALLSIDAYRHAGRTYDVRDKARAVASGLAGAVTHIEVASGLLTTNCNDQSSWHARTQSAADATLGYAELPFEHPLWVLFSSGTTGVPKALVHGHGGIILEHLKSLSLHNDVRPGDVVFWYTSTAWMMWNYLIGVLLRGATAVLYDGRPDPATLWKMADEDGPTLFGASPGFYRQSLQLDLPAHAPSALRTLGSTGSPLTEETHTGLAQRLPDVHIASVSGGTDVCSGFVGPSPILPVTPGKMQCRMLGVDCVAVDSSGRVVEETVGELVIRQPMPSMPLYIWGDDGGERLRDTYFTQYPGLWCHGDWIVFDSDGQSTITGRSDATLNRGGVRMGTSEFYRVLEALPWVHDSLVVDVAPTPAAHGQLILFLTTDDNELTHQRIEELRAAVRGRLSPRHVPDHILAVDDLPYTLTGKKCEIPVKRLLLGATPEQAADTEALRNPAALASVVEAARCLLEGAVNDRV